MAAGHGRGTVTSLSDEFSQASAELVAKHVQGAVAQLEQQVRELERFAEENLALSKLVRQLPDSVSHQVMVPFGKAAFFPGRLVHTNEFMVLLGERYYAERSAKQTVQFLARRGDYLYSKLAGVKAQVADLQAEASFARTAAEEAAAGMVEIREEYKARPRIEEMPEAADANRPVVHDEEDEEHERVMARIAELEFKEAAVAAEGEEDTDEDSWEDQEDGEEDDDDDWIDELLNPAVRQSLLPGRLGAQAVDEDEETASDVFEREQAVPLEQQLGYGRPAIPSTAGTSKGILSTGDHGSRIARPGRRVRFSENLVEPKVVERLKEPVEPTSRSTLTDMAEIQEYKRKGVGQPLQVTVPRHMESKEERDARGSNPSPGSGGYDPVPTSAPQRRFTPNSPFPGARRAFTGAVVEHGEGSSAEQQLPEQRKRPISRFRKQLEET